MRILVFSDLHREFWKGKDLTPPLPDPSTYDVVVAAGDIDMGTKGATWLAETFDCEAKPVIYVPGNHEYYRHEYHQLNEELEITCRNESIHLLNPGTIMIDQWQFIGANMWTDFKLKGHPDLEPYQLNGFADFNVIEFNDGLMTHSAMKQINQLELGFVLTQLQQANQNTVVINHFVPTQLAIADKWKDPRFSSFNPYFTNDLDHIYEGTPLVIFGHTHDRYDFVHPNGTRYVGNPFGYPKENNVPYEWKIVEI